MNNIVTITKNICSDCGKTVGPNAEQYHKHPELIKIGRKVKFKTLPFYNPIYPGIGIVCGYAFTEIVGDSVYSPGTYWDVVFDNNYIVVNAKYLKVVTND